MISFTSSLRLWVSRNGQAAPSAREERYSGAIRPRPWRGEDPQTLQRAQGSQSALRAVRAGLPAVMPNEGGSAAEVDCPAPCGGVRVGEPGGVRDGDPEGPNDR